MLLFAIIDVSPTFYGRAFDLFETVERGTRRSQPSRLSFSLQDIVLLYHKPDL